MLLDVKLHYHSYLPVFRPHMTFTVDWAALRTNYLPARVPRAKRLLRFLTFRFPALWKSSLLATLFNFLYQLLTYRPTYYAYG